LPKRASNGQANITLAFIFIESSSSISVVDTPEASILTLASSSRSYVHPRVSTISNIYNTSEVLGTLCRITGLSVNNAAGISLIILFLFGTGFVVPCNGFHPLIISFDINIPQK
jgi:hypothetical protein